MKTQPALQNIRPCRFKPLAAFYLIAASLMTAACSSESPGSDSIVGGGGGGGGGPTGITNRDPIAVADMFTVPSGNQNEELDVLQNDSDPDGDNLALENFPTTTSGAGTLTRDENGTANDLSDDTILYTPNSSFVGTDSFSYTINDGNGGTAIGMVEIEVTAQTAAPAACADKTARLANGEGYCFFATFNTAHDGTLIEMTVYVPHPNDLKALTEDTTGTSLTMGEEGFAPLLIHGHGFGGSMQTDFENNKAHFVDSKTADAAWKKGYFVISFSERGFGESGGEIGFMNPRVEGQDHNELLDWAVKFIRGDSGSGDGIYQIEWDETNSEHTSSTPVAGGDSRPSLLQNDNQTRLIPLAKSACSSADTEDCDPAVGTLGYSYGGGWQYTASHADEEDLNDLDGNTDREEQQRWDALIPEGTWHDLRYSLHANDVPKTYWASLLLSFAAEGGNTQTPPEQFLVEIYSEATTQGRVSAGNQNIIGGFGTSFYCDENNGVTTTADVFHIQGIRDTLFDFNEAYDNIQCFDRSPNGNDARLLMVSGGHPLTVTQQEPYTGQRTSMDIDEVIHCASLGIDTDGDGDMDGQERLVVHDIMLAWFEEKLRGQTGAADVIPNVCITAENTDPNDALDDPDFTQQANSSFNYLKEGIIYDDIDDVLVGATAPSGGTPTYSCDGDTDHLCEVDETYVIAIPVSAPEVCEARFVPLYTVPAGESRLMSGIPTVKLSFSGETLPAVPPLTPEITLPPPIDYKLFIGTGLQRDGSTVVIHDQLTAVRNATEFPLLDTPDPITNELVVTENGNTVSYGCSLDDETLCDRARLHGVSVRLIPDDVVGLVIKSCDVQYSLITNTPGAVVITGDVELPILAPSPLPESNN